MKPLISQYSSRGSLRPVIKVTVIVWTFITVSIVLSLFGPDPFLYRNGDWDDMSYAPYHNSIKWSVLLDGHSHTLHSDGRLTPEQNIQWHLAHGFNAAVISDHDSLDGALATREIARSRYNDSIKILPGLEWSTDRVHMNLIGMSDGFIHHFSHGNYHRTIQRDPSDRDIQQIIETVHRLGGIVVVNHYARNFPDRPSREELLSWGVDHFEIVNDNNNGRSVYDQITYEFSIENGLGVLTGSDMHDPARMRVHGWTLLSPGEFTEESILNELKMRRTDILYNHTGVPYTVTHRENPWHTVLKPVMDIGTMFLNYAEWPTMDWVAIGLFFGYIEGGSFSVGMLNVKPERKNGKISNGRK